MYKIGEKAVTVDNCTKEDIDYILKKEVYLTTEMLGIVLQIKRYGTAESEMKDVREQMEKLNKRAPRGKPYRASTKFIREFYEI